MIGIIFGLLVGSRGPELSTRVGTTERVATHNTEVCIGVAACGIYRDKCGQNMQVYDESRVNGTKERTTYNTIPECRPYMFSIRLQGGWR